MAKKASDISVDPKLIELLETIRKSRVTMREIRAAMHERALVLGAGQTGSEQEVDEARLELEIAIIQLAEAEIALLKARSPDPKD